MRHITLLVAVLAATPLTNLLAQNSSPVAVGTRVRVTAYPLAIDKYDGTLQGWADDSVTVDTLQVALKQLTRLDVYRGRKSNWGKGALIGAASLASVGAALALVACSDGTCDGTGVYALTTGDVVGVFALGGALGGALIGAVIGALAKSDRWEEVPLDQFRMSFAPQRDGRFAFGLSVAF
jgi:hypothetical protein